MQVGESTRPVSFANDRLELKEKENQVVILYDQHLDRIHIQIWSEDGYTYTKDGYSLVEFLDILRKGSMRVDVEKDEKFPVDG